MLLAPIFKYAPKSKRVKEDDEDGEDDDEEYEEDLDD